jgi:hypothetical protein
MYKSSILFDPPSGPGFDKEVLYGALSQGDCQIVGCTGMDVELKECGDSRDCGLQ